jgi:hypothetical protein
LERRPSTSLALIKAGLAMGTAYSDEPNVAIIDDAAAQLSLHVYAVLRKENIDLGTQIDEHVLEIIDRLVANAMLIVWKVAEQMIAEINETQAQGEQHDLRLQ